MLAILCLIAAILKWSQKLSLEAIAVLKSTILAAMQEMIQNSGEKDNNIE